MRRNKWRRVVGRRKREVLRPRRITAAVSSANTLTNALVEVGAAGEASALLYNASAAATVAHLRHLCASWAAPPSFRPVELAGPDPALWCQFDSASLLVPQPCCC